MDIDGGSGTESGSGLLEGDNSSSAAWNTLNSSESGSGMEDSGFSGAVEDYYQYG